jgi:hypothetical protein
MKAVIENKNGIYLIRIYGSDGIPCDAYAIDEIKVSTPEGYRTLPKNKEAKDEDFRFIVEKVR